MFLSYKTMFEGRCNWEEVMKSKTVRDFDKAFTVPLFGYKDWNEELLEGVSNPNTNIVPQRC